MSAEVSSLPSLSEAGVSVPPIPLEDIDLEDDLEDPETLDLSSQNLEKLTRARPEWQLNATTLILDDNQLQRLDNIHTFQCIEKVKIIYFCEKIIIKMLH